MLAFSALLLALQAVLPVVRCADTNSTACLDVVCDDTSCCLESTGTCATETRDCAEETDDDYIENNIFYIVGAFFGLWVLYKVVLRAYGYYRSRKEHARLTEG
jgi:hypothetical protein